MAKRTNYRKLEPRLKLIRDIEELKYAVSRLEKLYKEFPSLYDQVDLSDILHIPVDAWLERIDTFLDEEYRQLQIKKEIQPK